MTDKPKQNRSWRVYIILCSDNSLYTGITTNLEKRLAQHISGKGARYFRGRKPEKVVYLENCHNRGEAAKREAEIKKMRRADKCLLIELNTELTRARVISDENSGAFERREKRRLC